MTQGNNTFAQLSGVTDQFLPTLIIHGSPYPNRTYSLDSTPFQDIADELGFADIGSRFGVRDVAIADFNGDLLSDLYLARLRNASSVERIGDAELRAGIIVSGDEKGFRFRATGDIGFEIGPPFRIGQSNIFIGSQGSIPQDREFTLSQSTAEGLLPHTPGVDFSLFIGYNQEQDLWEVFASREAFLGLNIVVRADETITALSTVGFQKSNGELSDRLLVNNGEQFQDATSLAGLATATACGSVAAADFDNDMDTDLYLVCRGPVLNVPNVLYENLGTGQFEVVPKAGGAEGSDVGMGDSVATADYDTDGFIDLFVTNGNGDPPFDGGPQQLFRNLGNENGWLEVDLEGVVSNRDGIGARLIASAGGVTQVREQAGGMHFASQNHQRVHFGLGKNRRVEQMTVEWPSGIVQEINNVPANELIRVIEPSLPSIFGKPIYQPGVDRGVFVWQDSVDGPYHLRVNGDGPLSVFTINIMAEAAFESVEQVQLEEGDRLASNGNFISFRSRVSTWEDGIDFTLPTGTKVLIAIEKDGKPDPRELHVGADGEPLSPVGWILDIGDLGDPPAFRGGRDLGLFIGTDGQDVVARWNGDGFTHRTRLEMLFSEPIVDVRPVDLESNEFPVTSSVSVQIDGYVGTWWDGLDVAVEPGTKLGLTYIQDSLFQANRINPSSGALGPPTPIGCRKLDIGRPISPVVAVGSGLCYVFTRRGVVVALLPSMPSSTRRHSLT